MLPVSLGEAVVHALKVSRRCAPGLRKTATSSQELGRVQKQLPRLGLLLCQAPKLPCQHHGLLICVPSGCGCCSGARRSHARASRPPPASLLRQSPAQRLPQRLPTPLRLCLHQPRTWRSLTPVQRLPTPLKVHIRTVRLGRGAPGLRRAGGPETLGRLARPEGASLRWCLPALLRRRALRRRQPRLPASASTGAGVRTLHVLCGCHYKRGVW